MNFFGRKKELETITSLFSLKGVEGAIVYGRRRLGKSSLIKQASTKFSGKVIYLQCVKSVNAINIKNLILLVKKIFSDVLISENASFEEIIDFIFKKSMNENILLIIDEYPYLGNREYIDSYLQLKIDEYKEISNLKLILSGSYVSVMENLLNVNNPLHGRLRYKILLDEFDYFDASNFYPHVSNEDKIKYYAVFGGTPYYLALIDENKTFEENVISLILDEFAPLDKEINSTINEEYGKVENLTYLMSLITSGKHSYTDINKAFKMVVPNSDINYLFKILLDLKIITKTYAINDDNENKAFYNLNNNLLAFYYNLVFPSIVCKSIMDIHTYFNEYIKDRLYSSFIPKQFENICKQFLIRKNKLNKINPPLLKIGSYVYNNAKRHLNGQFDIVSEDKNGNIFYECKFTSSPIDKKVIEEEKLQLNNIGLNYYKLGFFSKSGYLDNSLDCNNVYYKLNDLFN